MLKKGRRVSNEGEEAVPEIRVRESEAVTLAHARVNETNTMRR